jgi:hypothetical protein
MKKFITAFSCAMLSALSVTLLSGCATDDTGHVMYSDAVIRSETAETTATLPEIKNWNITLVSASVWTDTADFMPSTPREGYKLVKIVLDVKNLTEEPQFFTYLSDMLDKEYAPLIQNNTQEGGFIEEIAPGAVLHGAVVFEVPVDMTDFVYYHLANDQRFADIELQGHIS